MQSGAPTFGTPEPSLVHVCRRALARRLGVPFRSGGGLCASKIPDAQAAYESANTLQTRRWPASTSCCTRPAGSRAACDGLREIHHGCRPGQHDADIAGGVDLSENGQAMDALREVGPGSHFLGAAHTQANFETAFYRSHVADNNSFEQWEQDGALDAAARPMRLEADAE